MAVDGDRLGHGSIDILDGICSQKVFYDKFG